MIKVHNKFLSLLLIGSLLADCGNQASEVAEPTTVETETLETQEDDKANEASETEDETEDTADEDQTADGESDVLEGEGRGHEAGLKVAVTMDGDKIANVKGLEHNESDEIANQALVDVPAAIAEHNYIAVDGVSGATEISAGIRMALELGTATNYHDSGIDITTHHPTSTAKVE